MEEGVPVAHMRLPVCVKLQLTFYLIQAVRQAVAFAFSGFLSA